MSVSIPTINLEQFKHSVGEQLSFDASAGMLHFNYPCPLPSGQHKYAPSFSLSYTQSGRNSIFGRGWSGSQMKVSRQMKHHFPLYQDDQESDVFVISGIGELTPLYGQNGERRTRQDGDYWVYLYRAAHEGSFTKVERWQHQHQAESYWKVQNADNSTLIFGQNPMARIADPVAPHKVFEWLLELSFDEKGHAIVYEYKAENTQNIDRTASYELGRNQAFNQKYLKRIHYGNTLPYENSPNWTANNQWLFEMVLDYGEHPTNPNQAYSEQMQWEARLDAYSYYQAGFEIRTYRQCKRLLFFTHLDATTAVPQLHSAVELEQVLQEGICELRSIHYKGYRQVAGLYQSKTLPPIEFQYSKNYSNQALKQQPIRELPLQNIPAGVSGIGYNWVDLYKDGIPGILVEQAQAWYYKPNYGQGIFGDLELVNYRPSNTGGNYHLADWDNNGQLECLVTSANTAGYYEQNAPQKKWENFQTIDQNPIGGNSYQFTLDIDGAGYPDLLQINSPQEAIWYNSKGKEGYEAPQYLTLPTDLPFHGNNSQELLTLADMTGDGLQDLVAISNGNVAYWPHLGYGRFGAKITLQVPHIFDSIDTFEVQKIMLLDVTGTGTTDIVYMGHQEVHIYSNYSGNSLVLSHQIEHWGGQLSENNHLAILDIMGDGTQALVWSNTPIGQQVASIHYLLLNEQPPHLLQQVDNNLGRLSKIHYSSAVAYALAAKREGNPWYSQLSNYPIVVTSIEEVDLIAGAVLIKRYKYKDGYYDGTERQFRGFAYVEQRDTEQFEQYNNLPVEEYVAPTLTKSWFYNGLLGQDPTYTKQFLQEHAKANLVELPKVVDLQNQLVYLSPEEEQEAYLVLNGTLRRQEIHCLDAAQDSLVSITEQAHILRCYQHKKTTQHKAIFALFTTEDLEHVCDGVPLSDARINHHLSWAIDAYGVATKSCAIVYGRQVTIAHPEQQITQVVYSTQRVLHLDQPILYRLGTQLEQQSYAIAGLDALYQGTVLDALTIQQHIATALQQVIPQEQTLNHQISQAQLLAWNKIYYTSITTQEALPLGTVQSPLLMHHQEQIGFTNAWAQQIWQGKVTANYWEQIGYKEAEGWFWQYSAAYTYYDKAHFYLPKTVKDTAGAATHYKYDDFNLFTTEVSNALGQVSNMSYDYQALAVAKQTDINGNTTAFGYDALTNQVALTQYGEQLENGQVIKAGHQSFDNFNWQAPNNMAALLQEPQQFLQGITAYFYYDCWAWKERQEPLVVVALRNEQDQTTTTTGIQINLGYVDGFGRSLQSKMRVEAGQALQITGTTVQEQMVAERWLVSGRVVYNNKQEAIKQYEPFYSATWQYEQEAVLDTWGESSQLFYDALGRMVKTVHPSGTFEKTVYSTWQEQYFDANDTIKDSLYYTINSSLPNSNPTKQMLDQIEQQHNTPTIQHLDNLGRPFLVQKNSANSTTLDTHTTYDLLGNITKVKDARGIVLSQHQYDLLGQSVYMNSADSGERWSLYDNRGLNTDNWIAKGAHLHQKYDLLGRLVELWATENNQQQLLQKSTYGNSLNTATAQHQNALGQAIIIEDAAGRRTMNAFNIRGQLLQQTQELCKVYQKSIDWSQPVTLEPEKYISKYQYDALGKVIFHQKPDGSQHLPQYTQNGRLKQMQVKAYGEDSNTQHTFLQDSTYNARGQLTNRQLGNQVSLQYTYDNKEFRLQSFKAIHQQGSQHRHLQWNNYHYDAVGNIVCVEDHAMTSLLGNHLPSPVVKQYSYDAHYRLTRATGVIHQSFNQWDGARNKHSNPIAFKGTQHLHSNNSQAVETYTRTYQYDASGNMQAMQHQGQTKRWTRDYWIDNKSNRSLLATTYNGTAINNPSSHFDVAGNIIQLEHLRALHWNCLNQLQKVVLIERSSATDDAEYYVYNSAGMRTRRVTERLVGNHIEQVEKRYLDGCEIIIKKTKDRVTYQATSTIVQAEGQQKLALIHHISTGKVADEPATTIRYQVGNHLGSVAMETDEQGQIISYEEYFPFGGTAFLFGKNKREVARKTYRYSGKEKDDATGLYYYGFRYYVPWLCRWLSPDPVGMKDGPNIYAFVQNNPINLVDDWGLDAKAAQLFRQEYDNLKYQGKIISNQKGIYSVYTSKKHGTFYVKFGQITGYDPNGNAWYALTIPKDEDYLHVPLEKETKSEKPKTKTKRKKAEPKRRRKKRKPAPKPKAEHKTDTVIPPEPPKPPSKKEEKKKVEKKEEKDLGTTTASPQKTASDATKETKTPNSVALAPKANSPKKEQKKPKENLSMLGRWVKHLDDAAKELAKESKNHGTGWAIATGIWGGIANMGIGTLKIVDTVTDFGAFWGSLIGEGIGVVDKGTTDKIAARLDKKIDAAGAIIKHVANNPWKTVTTIHAKAVDTLADAFNGNKVAIHKTTAVLTELGVGLATGQAAKSATPLSAAGKMNKAVKTLEKIDAPTVPKQGIKDKITAAKDRLVDKAGQNESLRKRIFNKTLNKEETRLRRQAEKLRRHVNQNSSIISESYTSRNNNIVEVDVHAYNNRTIGYNRAPKGTVHAFGVDDDVVAATLEAIVPKKGWSDVVVHGASNGAFLDIGVHQVDAGFLYKLMINNGYVQGTPIRLNSCWSGSIDNGVAHQLAQLAQAPVMAPTGMLQVGSFIGKGKWNVVGRAQGAPRARIFQPTDKGLRNKFSGVVQEALKDKYLFLKD